MKTMTIIASTVAALSMGAIGFTHAQSNVTPGSPDTTMTPQDRSAPDSNRSTSPGSMRGDTTTNERVARADRN